MFSYERGPDGEILAEEQDEIPADKEEGQRMWRWEMEMRFVRGGDPDFDYHTVDSSDEYDDHMIEELEAQERYFDEQEPEFVMDDGVSTTKNAELQGETGIQDF